MGLNGGIDLTGLINTDGLEKKLDPAIEKLDAIVDRLDKLAGKKAKIEFDSSGVKDVNLLNDSLEKLDKKIKAPKQKMAYFQSIENATIDMKKTWNDFIRSFNNGEISSDNLYDNKAATKVLRYANAFEALGGNISNVSPEISEFINKMRSIDKYTQNKGYNFTVTGFQEAFAEFEKMQQLGINFSGFDSVKNDVTQLLSLSAEAASSIQNVGTQIGNSFGSSSGAMDGAINDQREYQHELENTRKEIVLTEEQMKKKLQSSYSPQGYVDEWSLFYDLDIDDTKLSNIEKYSKALDNLKVKQQEALEEATYYQNRIAESKNAGVEPDSYHNLWMQKNIDDYHKYTEQIEYVQERLQSALKSYTPNAEGDNAQAINALVLLLQNLNDQIEKVRIAFGSIDDNSDVPNLLSSIQELKQGIVDTVTEIKNIAHAISGINFNVNISTGSGKNPIQQMSEYGDSARRTTKVLQEAFAELQSITGFSLDNNGIKYLTKDAKDLISEIERISNLETVATTGKVDGKRNIKQQNIALKELIDLYQKAASYANIDLSGWTEKYSNNINKSIESTQKILTGEKQAEDATKQLTSLFGNANNITLSGLTAEIDKVIAKLQEMIELLRTGLDVNKINLSSNGQNGLNAESLDLEALKNKILEVKNAILLKNNAFSQEEKIVSSTVKSEVNQLQLLHTNLKVILETLKQIQEIPIKLNISGFEDGNNKESVLKSIENLKNSLNGLDPNLLKELNNILKGLSIEESIATNIQKLANAILNLKSNLNNVSPSSTEFLNSIKELVSQAGNLKDLATVIRASKEEIEKAKVEMKSDVATAAGVTPTTKPVDIAKDSKDWKKITQEASAYKDVIGDIQRITYSMRQDKDGKQLKSYRVIGSKSSITLGDNLNLVAEKETQVYRKTAEELNKIRNDFINAANNAGFSFDLSSLKVDQNGVITFTSTIEKAGQEAVTTKYKIEDLYKVINDGVLNKESLNSGSQGINTKDLSKLQEKRDKEAYDAKADYGKRDQIELYNSLSKAVQQYIYWLNQESKATGSAKEMASLLREGYENLVNLLRTDIGSYGLKNAEKELEIENKILEARQKINYQNEVNKESQNKKATNQLASFNKQDQTELYKSLSTVVKEYVYWLNQENSATGSAKTMASELRAEYESLMELLRADIKSYGLQDLEKELELDKKILEERRKINYQNEQSTTKMAEASYNRELELEKKKNKLQINNLGASDKVIAKNNIRIAAIEKLIQGEQEYRQAMGLDGKAHESAVQLINKKATLTRNLLIEQEAYNASVEAGDKAKQSKQSYDKEIKWLERINKLEIDNINASKAKQAANNEEIRQLKEKIELERKLRDEKQLNTDIGNNRISNKQQELQDDLDIAVSKNKAGESSARTQWKDKAYEFKTSLKEALNIYTNATQEAKDKAKVLLDQLERPNFGEYNGIVFGHIDQSNVDSVVRRIQNDTNRIINALKEQHTKVENETKYAGQMKDYENQLNSLLQGSSFEDAVFKKATVDKSSGKTTITFLELVGNKAREVLIVLNDVDKAIDEIQNGTFNWNANKVTSNWRNATKDDIFGGDKSSESNNHIQKIINAYNELIKTEDNYQKLKAKVDAGVANNNQKAEYERLTKLREKYNNTISETIVLTEKEQLLYEQSGKNAIENLRQKYEKQKEDSSFTYDAYFNANKIEISTETQDALNNTKTLMDEIFAKKQNISGFQSVFDRAQSEVDELNKKLEQGKISNIQTGYTDKVNKIANDLNNVVAVVNPFNDKAAQQAMSEYAKTLNNGNVKIGDFTNKNKVLNLSFEEQKGILREVALVYNEMSGAISLVDKGTKKVKSVLTTFMDGINARFRSLVQYLAIFVSYYRIVGMIKNGIQVVRELDTALTEMRKVSDESVESLRNFQDASFDIAKSVGTTAKQIQNSTADFMRLGESLDEAAKSAEVANILLNVSEFEGIDEATDSLVAMSAAYDELEKIEIVDKLNLIGKIKPKHAVMYGDGNILVDNYIGRSLETDNTEERL